jgi:biotin operon repressor
MNYRARTLSPQESRVVLGLAEQKQREVSRPEIIELLGVKAKAANKVIDSLRRKGWLERASWGKYLVIPPEEGPDALGETNLLALASRITDNDYIGYGSAAAHYGLTTQHRKAIIIVTPAHVRGRQVGEGRVRIVNPKRQKFFGFGPVDSEEMSSLANRFHEVEIATESAVPLPSPLPASWLEPKSLGALVRFIDSRFDEQKTSVDIRRRFPNAKDVQFRALSLRAIFLAMARKPEEA